MEKWIRELPRSRVAYPIAKRDRLKYWLFRAYEPFHKPVRGTSLALRILKHEGREEPAVGIIKPDRSIPDFVSFLIEHEYGNHFIAWREEGELVSLRKTIGFTYQYHVRIFKDGAVRCHYEYTPECHPFLHLRLIGIKDDISEFRTLVREWLVPN